MSFQCFLHLLVPLQFSFAIESNQVVHQHIACHWLQAVIHPLELIANMKLLLHIQYMEVMKHQTQNKTAVYQTTHVSVNFFY